MTTKRVDAIVKALGEDSDFPGSFEVTLSAPTVDRDNELVAAGAFHPLPDHVTFDVDHSLDVAGTVGSGRPYYAGDRLMVAGTFARTDLAQTVRSLVADRHIRTVSVAMRNPLKEKRDDGVVEIKSAELINGSFVSVPSCREALVVASKQGARNSAGDQALLDHAHDDLAAAGANCPGVGKSLQAQALELTKEGKAVEDDDALWIRAKALRARAQLAIARATLADLSTSEPPSRWDDRLVDVGNGVRISAGLKQAIDEARAARPKFAPIVRGAGEATLDPAAPPVRAVIEPQADPDSTGMYPSPFDYENPVTIPRLGSIAVEHDQFGNITNQDQLDRWAPYWDADE